MSKRPDLDRAMERFFEDARRELFPKLKASAIVMSIVAGEVDAKLALELGASLLLDKPIIIMIEKGTVVSPRLRMVVDEWIEFEDINHPQTLAQISAAMQRLMARKPSRREGEK